MKKRTPSVVPWSLILSLSGWTAPAYAQEDQSLETENSTTVDSSEVESTTESPLPGSDESTVTSSTNEIQDPPAVFDPRHQMAASSDIQPPTVQEIAAFKQSYKRYRHRIDDFRNETLLLVELEKEAALEQIRKQYTTPIGKLEQDYLAQRVTAIERFERFITKYPKAPDGAAIRFQLADIYFKMAEESFTAENEAYFLKLEENPDLELNIQKDLSKAFKLYKEIVELFPESDVLDGALYMMAWCYADADSDLYDADLSAQFFQRVVDEYPTSKFVAQANYFVGQYYFNKNEIDRALVYFQQATDLSRPKVGSFNSLFEYANYRLAWTHYLLNHYDEALALFTLHQDYSASKLRETGTPSNTLEESYEYTALSFIDVADKDGSEPVEVAKAYYDKVGEREYTAEVFVYLSKELVDQVSYLEAIDVYRYLQDNWPNAPENPTYQKKLAELYLLDGEVDSYMDEMKILTDRYAENGEWWVQNRNNPEAQDIARSYIEESLLDVAYNQYNKAIESQEPAVFMDAVESFGQYLSRFPFSDDYYEAMWYMADALLSAGEVKQALEQYRTLIKTGADHHRGELSQLKVLNITNELALNRLMGSFGQLEEDVEVKEERKLSNGDMFEVYALSQEVQEFIQAYTDSEKLDYQIRLLRVEESLGELQRSGGEASSKQIATLEQLVGEINGGKEFFDLALKSYQYNIGQIYHGHAEYELARQYFNLVIDSYPTSVEALYAATLIIASYQKELNWPMVKTEASRFIALALGPDGVVPEDFANYEKNATLQILIRQNDDAKDLMAKGEVEEATRLYNLTADGVMQYLTDYPDLDKEEYANLLLLSGNIYESGGNIEKANAVYRQYVDQFPGNKASRSLLFSIATNHQNALEFEEAIKYFDILYKQTYGRGEPYPDAIGALYNSALLKVGLGQYKEAAEGLEFYARKFSDQPDAEESFFSAGQYWEKVANWRALDFYTRYLKAHKGDHPDRTMRAHYRRIEIYSESGAGKKKEMEREWVELIKTYEQMLAAGKDSTLMRTYAAEYYMRDIPNRLKEFQSVKYTRDDKKNADIMKDQLAALDELRAYCTKPGEQFKDFEAIVAGRYCVGTAELHLSKFIQAFPIPDVIVPGDEDANYNAQVIFEEQLAKIWEPLREGAIAGLEQAITLSEKQGRWTDWTQLSLNELSAMDPKSYPPQKQEVVYPMSSVYVSTIGPISMDSPNNQAEEETEDNLPVPEQTETDPMSPDGNGASEIPEGSESNGDSGTDEGSSWGEGSDDSPSEPSETPTEESGNGQE